MEHTEQEYRQVLQFIAKKLTSIGHSKGMEYDIILVDSPVFSLVGYSSKHSCCYCSAREALPRLPIMAKTAKQFYCTAKKLATESNLDMHTYKDAKDALVQMFLKPIEELLVMSDIG